MVQYASMFAESKVIQRQPTFHAYCKRKAAWKCFETSLTSAAIQWRVAGAQVGIVPAGKLAAGAAECQAAAIKADTSTCRLICTDASCLAKACVNERRYLPMYFGLQYCIDEKHVQA